MCQLVGGFVTNDLERIVNATCEFLGVDGSQLVASVRFALPPETESDDVVALAREGSSAKLVNTA